MKISTGESRTARVWNEEETTWQDFIESCRDFSEFNVGEETHQQYMDLPKDRQAALKDVGGFVGGSLLHGHRKKGHCTGRDLITMDADNLTAESAADLMNNLNAAGYSYLVYSTRKHEPENPRLRVIIPTDRTVLPDEYVPLARAVAATLDRTMSAWDRTTFEPERLMYWPSSSADSEVIFLAESSLPFLDPDDVLEDFYNFEDWHNTTLWPLCPAESEPTVLGDKQADPMSKQGIVGAFCRTYSIPAAMDKFIPGIYEEAGQGRYTYTAGTTTGGAVLYDDEKFLYSHHSTDPCGGHLVNAWDMVRIHRFAGMDAESAPDTPPNKLPSYEAMRRLATTDAATFELYTKEREAEALDGFEIIDGEDADTDWHQKLQVDKKGNLLCTTQNMRLIMENDEAVAGKFWIDKFANRIMCKGRFPWEGPPEERVWRDSDDAGMRWWMETKYHLTSKARIDDAVCMTAERHARDPVVEYLNGLEWDGTERLDTLFIEYLRADDNRYTRAVTRKVFTAAVARAYQPGTKFDQVVIISGAQGAGKSSLIAKMGRKWFSDSITTFNGKEARESIQGVWLVELGELTVFDRSEAEAIKQFVSQTEDNYRPAYGRRTEQFKRRCVFFGTSNKDEYLRDNTGNRRFWPIQVYGEEKDNHVLELLTDDVVDQIWAEAKQRYIDGEPLYLTGDLREDARTVQAMHQESDAWAGGIEEFVSKKVPKDWDEWDTDRRESWWAGSVLDADDIPTEPRKKVCVAEVWVEFLHQPIERIDRKNQLRIGQILSKIEGWENLRNSRIFGPYGKQRAWVKVR